MSPKLIEALLGKASKQGVTRAVLGANAKCIAAVVAGDPLQCKPVVEKLKGMVKNPAAAPFQRVLGLLAIGHIGRPAPEKAMQAAAGAGAGASCASDLSSDPQIVEVIRHALDMQDEDVKAAAATCLGSLAVGNTAVYLPIVFEEITARQTQQYLLLHSLKELLQDRTRGASSSSGSAKAVVSAADSTALVAKSLDLLFSHCDNDEEGVRNMVAECLGMLCNIEGQFRTVKDRLDAALVSAASTANTKSTMVNAVKYAVSAKDLKVRRPPPLSVCAETRCSP